jgi:hypothetical protein
VDAVLGLHAQKQTGKCTKLWKKTARVKWNWHLAASPFLYCTSCHSHLPLPNRLCLYKLESDFTCQPSRKCDITPTNVSGKWQETIGACVIHFIFWPDYPLQNFYFTQIPTLQLTVCARQTTIVYCDLVNNLALLAQLQP